MITGASRSGGPTSRLFATSGGAAASLSATTSSVRPLRAPHAASDATTPSTPARHQLTILGWRMVALLEPCCHPKRDGTRCRVPNAREPPRHEEPLEHGELARGLVHHEGGHS